MFPFDVKVLVRKEGFEPPRPFGHKILSLARLPVPPLPQWYHQYTGNGPCPATFADGHDGTGLCLCLRSIIG